MIYAGIGSRKTTTKILNRMELIGKYLAKHGAILRSGGALGADSAFERGCDSVNGVKEIYVTPDNPNRTRKGYFGDMLTKEHYDLVRKYHPKPERLSNHAMDLMARNGCQVLGRNLDKPSDIIICWTEGGLPKGGTAQAIRLATKHAKPQIPVINLGSPEYENVSAMDIAEIAKKRVEQISFFG